jgi:hypothetical protein
MDKGPLKISQNPHQVHEQPEAAPLFAPFIFQADAYRPALVGRRLYRVFRRCCPAAAANHGRHVRDHFFHMLSVIVYLLRSRRQFLGSGRIFLNNIVDFYNRLADLFDAFGLLNRSDRDLADQVKSG